MAENKPEEDKLKENKLKLKKENIDLLLDAKFLKVYDFHYAPERSYYVASRRDAEALPAIRSKEDFQGMLPDAVSCVVVLKCKDKEPLLCLTKEMRFPIGQFLLGVPAGLLDPEDAREENPVFCAAKRELWEEAGIEWTDADEIKWINPLLFSSPGMTDESNAMVHMTLNRESMPKLTSEGAVGGECFDGFVLINRDEAREILMEGRDGDGLYYSVYTWIALTCFVSGLWD